MTDLGEPLGPDIALQAGFAQALLASAESGTRLRRRDLSRFADSGKLAATSGASLTEAINSYLGAAWRLWPQLPAAQAMDGPALFRAGEAMLRGIDDAVAAVAEGYQRARRDVAQTQFVQRREFIDDLLLGGSHDAADMVLRAGRFGIELTGPHAVLVVEAQKPFADSAPPTSLLERVVLQASPSSDALVTTRDGRLVVVVGAADAAAIKQLVDAMSATLPSTTAEPAAGVRLNRLAAVGRWRIGVGRRQRGPEGIRQSFADALEALRIGARLNAGPVIDAADLLVQRVLVRDEAAMRDLVDAVLSPLGRARGGAEPLIATLRAYFAAGANSAAAARALHLSVRALTYRLSRIAVLTGHDPTDPAQRFVLETAVLGAQMLDETR